MTVHANMLREPLARFGFSPGLPTAAVDELTFVRPSYDRDLYESIIIGRQGKRREAVYASIAASVTWEVQYRIMGQVDPLLELGEDPERHWTIIKDLQKAQEWARRLVEVAPQRCSDWAKEKGPSILEETKVAREAVNRYLVRLDFSIGLEGLLERLRQSASPQIQAEVYRLFNSPGAGIGVPGTKDAKEAAYFILLLFSPEIEPEGKYFGVIPINNVEYMKRIHILADRIWQRTVLE